MQSNHLYVAGLDIGSTMTKVVILDEGLRASVIGPTGAEHRRLANEVMAQALAQAGLEIDELAYIVATGYGRVNVPFADKQITEITCHARGASSLFPAAKTVIDIGGQDCKGIKLAQGRVVDFVMNDKCAAGTGRFLEVISEALGVKLEEIGALSLQAKRKASISSTCTVFAEQEVVSSIAEGTPLKEVLAGIHEAIASRVYRLVERLKVEPEVVMSGGGAKNIGLVRALEEKLGCLVKVPQEPLLVGALGAALLAREQALKAPRAPARQPAHRRLEQATFFT